MGLKSIIFNNKTIAKNTFYLSIIEVVRLIMPFVALPYILKTIGTENYGIIAFAQSIIAYFSVLVAFGLDISAVKNVSENRSNRDELSKIVSSVLIIKFLLFVVSSFVLAAIVYWVPFLKIHYVVFLFAFIACLSDLFFPVWFFQGIEKMQLITIVRLSAIIMYVISIFVFIHNDSDYILIPLLQSLSFIVTAIGGLFFLIFQQRIRLFVPQKRYIVSVFKESIPFFFSRVSVVINHNIAKTFSGILLGMNEVAIFDIAQKIISAAIIPLNMMSHAIYPHNANNKDKVFAKKTFNLIVIIAMVISIIVLVFAPMAIRILGINDVYTCSRVCYILCLWLLAAAIAIYLGAPMLVAFGYPKPYNKSVLYSTVFLFMIYIILYLLNIFSIYFFAFVLVFTDLFVAGYRLFYCKKYKIL